MCASVRRQTGIVTRIKLCTPTVWPFATMGKFGRAVLVLAEIFSLGFVCGFEWDTSPDDFIYACPGNKVTLAWRFKVTEDETVVSLTWIHDGALSSEVMATMVRDHFVATDAYAARVQHVENGGLVLKDLFVEDSGNYTVEVNVATEGMFHSFQRSALLQVGDGHMLKGDLKAEQDPEARWEESSQQWFIRLTCGTFTFLGPPPLDILWTNPDGKSQPSSGYESGHFYLSLATPVRGGNYTCSIPPARLPDLCYRDQDGHDKASLSSAVAVDEMKARLSLLEANQKTLRENNVQLQEKILSLEQTHVQDMQNITEYCQDIVHSVEEQMDKVQSMQQTVQDKLQFLHNKTVQAALTGPCRPDNYKVMDDAWRSTSEGQNDLHCDDSLEPGWYRLFLNGRNAVMPTACVPKNHCQTHAPKWLDLQGQSLPAVGQEVEARACANWDEDCCNWQSDVTVRNCGEYFVYKLSKASNCHLAYCVEPQK